MSVPVCTRSRGQPDSRFRNLVAVYHRRWRAGKEVSQGAGALPGGDALQAGPDPCDNMPITDSVISRIGM